MKMNLVGVVITILLCAMKPTGHCQGTFVNLDFEHPNLPLIDDGFGRVPITNALPGWNGYINGSGVGSVFYNAISLGAPAISLHTTGSIEPILEGSYTVLLQPNFPGATFIPALAQVGIVPGSAQSVRFYGGPGFYSLYFSGQQIPLVNLASTANYTIFGGDISAFANQPGELRIQGGGLVDNIFFSDQRIPEPSTFAILAFGLASFGARLLRKRFS